MQDYPRETHFVGDSMTAESLESLGKLVDDRFARIEMRLDHLVKHDRAFPTEGCEYCGVPSAA
jgi:hypothetical protein